MKDITDKQITITFDELYDYELEFGKKIGLTILHENVKYEFILNLKKDSNKLLVLGSGALGFRKFDRSKPYIERHSWEFKQSAIYYHDPTYYIDDSIKIGWCIGTKDNYYLEKIAKIIEVFINKLNLINNDVLFYGSSAGGFTSLQLSVLLKGSTSLADIPQLYVYNFKSKAKMYDSWKDLKQQCYNDLSDSEFIEKYRHRLTFVDLIKKENYVPNAYLIMDFSVNLDVYSQYIPFLLELNNIPFDKYSNKIKLIVDGKKYGHAPISKQETIDLINSILSEETNESLISTSQLNFSQNSSHSLNLITNKLNKYNTVRIDVMFEGKKSELKIENKDQNSTVNEIKWLNDPNIAGYTILNDSNSTDFKINCKSKGKLSIKLRGINFLLSNKKRLPIYICITRLIVNGKDIIKGNKFVWHNEPYIHNINVSDEDSLNVHVEWIPC